MGRQWLHAKREVASLKKSQAVAKFVREIMVAARQGGGDPELNARLAHAIEKARRESVTREVIERAVAKGAGTGDEKMQIDQVVFEGYAPHKVPVVVEVMTDNNNRTSSEIRVLFRKGQLGTVGSNKFLFDHLGIVEAWTRDTGCDLEEAAILAGADDVAQLDPSENDDIPEDARGARFRTDRTAVHAVSQWLAGNGWQVVAAEMGYLAKTFPELDEGQREEVGAFLQALDDHPDVHRVWAAFR